MYVSGIGLGELSLQYDSPLVLEIGSAEGETSEYLLKHNKDLKLVSVDPYSNYMDWNGNYLDNRNNVYVNYMKRMEKYSDRFIQIRKISDDAVGHFEKDQFDIIFIDGLHTYDQLIKDCHNYYDKVKEGGLFSGHDYNVIREVNKAVNEFAEFVGKEILTTDNDVWYWYK